MQFKFNVIKTKGLARAGELKTAHGVVKTPVFMPVGTQASVKSLSPDDLKMCGAEIVLANTYHLYLRPGEKLIKNMGRLHGFMKWDGPILTDSGGFQVTSVKSKISDKGVDFFSHLDGSKHFFDAKKSMQIQTDLGADIIMAFDEATPDKGKRYAKSAMIRTHQWLKQSVSAWKKRKSGERQQLFGIIQGGDYKDLRRESAKVIVGHDLFGIAIGGGSIGQNAKQTEENVSWVRDLLPKTKPLYLMGVGVGPEDAIEAVKSGADMFDCVAPTRLARTGQLYQQKGKLNIANAEFKKDKRVILSNCDCYTCESGFSRAYLHHLFKARELLYYRLASLHNVRVMIKTVNLARKAILK